MRLNHLMFTVSAGPPADGEPLTTNKALQGQYVSLQPAPANTAVLYIGGINSSGDNVVSTTDYGIILPIPVGTVPCAPYPIDPFNQGFVVELWSIRVKGTAGEKLSVSYWTP